MDIQTRTPPARSSTRSTTLPFDWRVVATSSTEQFNSHDFSNPCADVGHSAVVTQVYGLAVDSTLHTAVILSLFIDRRAGDDDVLPLNQTDRRGWCGEEFMRRDDMPVPTGVEPWGSTLWLCYFTKATRDIRERARFAAWESLQWMVESGMADQVDVVAEWREGADHEMRLALHVQIYQADQSNPIYDVLWGTTIAQGASQ